MNVLSVCSGVGVADLGLKRALRGQSRTVLYVERDAHAASVLVARMEDEALDRAPIWDDLTTLDGRPLRGCVDLVSAGLPCQPYSLAGSLRGDQDSRALWPHLTRVVGESEPAFVFLENVPGFRKHAEGIWQSLRDLGFIWAPPLIQDAHSFGAPHRRERLFMLAAHPQRFQLWLERWWSRGACWTSPGVVGNEGPAGTNADRGGCQGVWCGWLLDEQRETLRHDPHGLGCRCRIGGSYWASESPVLRVADGPPARVDRLHAIGNAGAPPVAYSAAFSLLFRDITGKLTTNVEEKVR